MDPRLHFVVATAIIVRDGKYLIAKRAPTEKAYPNMWTVPGGKLVYSEYKDVPKTTKDAWYGIINWLLAKEVREEVGLEIENPSYLTDLLFVRPDGFPVITLSYWCNWKSGEVMLCKDLTDYKWVSLEEAREYELIEGIWDEIAMVEKIISKK
ncbi:MAG: hypothetical protein Q7S12_03250 [bacterium]|nr:hypothetical protein [bacterium]